MTTDLDRGRPVEQRRPDRVSRAAERGGDADARSRERVGAPAATVHDTTTDDRVPHPADRSGFHTYRRTGHYPLPDDLGARCAAMTAQLTTAAPAARIRARGAVTARALRRARREVTR